tara:strand:+ start:4522 stop:5667 length:1146 start_codon:yes stop_codon:yes gene_type:complete
VIDNATLLIAIAFSSATLAITLLISWLSARQDRYLINWAIGMALVVLALATMGLRNGLYDNALQMAAFSALISGVALIYLGTYEFSTGIRRHRPALWLWLAALASIDGAFLLGLSGPGTLLLNLWCALFLGLSGSHYWRARGEAPPQMVASAILFALTSFSFFCCAVMLGIEGPLVLEAPPSNWAEEFNSIMALIGLTGLGALALTLNQLRVSRRHRQEAHTDALTGLLNRRALFERFDRVELAAGTAVLMFDIDHFKQINDRLGHGTGDAVIRHFGTILTRNMRDSDITARIGGEEFCAILPGVALDGAVAVAERIRQDFQNNIVHLLLQKVPATVSAGVAVSISGEAFSAALNRADAALYEAKRGGRNRVTRSPPCQAA